VLDESIAEFVYDSLMYQDTLNCETDLRRKKNKNKKFKMSHRNCKGC
jgi:hypothetical protein